MLNEIQGSLSQRLEVQQNEWAENLESRIRTEFDRRQEQIAAQMEEARKRAELLINENAEAEARRRVEDEAQ